MPEFGDTSVEPSTAVAVTSAYRRLTGRPSDPATR